MKYLLHFSILIATTVLVKSDGTSYRIEKQSGYFYNKPKIAFEEGNSISENENTRVTASRKPISIQRTESEIENNLSVQDNINTFRIPIISVGTNTEKNNSSGTSKNKLVPYQPTTPKSSQTSKTNFEATFNQFGEEVTTQRSKLPTRTNEIYKPSFNEEHPHPIIILKTNTLQNQQYLKQKDRTKIGYRPLVTSFTQSPFNLYNGGDFGQKINQEKFFKVDRKNISSLKPGDSTVKAISFNDGISSFGLSQTINEGYVYSKQKTTTEISVKKPQFFIPTTSKSSNYMPTLIPQAPSTQYSRTQLPKLPAQQSQTTIPQKPFSSADTIYKTSGISSVKLPQPSFTKPSSKKPESSQSPRYKPGTRVLGPSGQLSFNGPMLVSQLPNYQIPIIRLPAYGDSITSNQQLTNIAFNTESVSSKPAQTFSPKLHSDRPSSIPKLQSYQKQNIITFKTSVSSNTQSKISATQTPLQTPLPHSFGGYVYKIPKKSFEEIPSANPTSFFSKVPSYQPPKTEHSDLKTSTFKPFSYKPLLYKPTLSPNKPSDLKPINYNEIQSHQISSNQGARITSPTYIPSTISVTTFPKYNPTSATQKPFKQSGFSTQINYSSSSYRPAFSIQTLNTFKPQAPTGYVYKKPVKPLEDQPSKVPKLTTSIESSSYRRPETVYNHNLNQSPLPQTPSSYKRPLFQVSHTQLSSNRPLNKSLQFSSTYKTTQFPNTQKYLETATHKAPSASLFYESSNTPDFNRAQVTSTSYRPSLPYKASQIKLLHEQIQNQTEDRPSQGSFPYRPPQILSSKPLTYYQPTKIAPSKPLKEYNKAILSFSSVNSPETQTLKELPQTSVPSKPSQIVPSLTYPQNLPSYNKSSQTVATYKPKQFSIEQQKKSPFYKASETPTPTKPPQTPSSNKPLKTFRPYKPQSPFIIPSEPPLNIFAKPISSSNFLLTRPSSSPKPQQIYSAPLSRYPSYKPIFQGPTYIPPLKSSSKNQFVNTLSSYKRLIPLKTTEKPSTYAASTYKPHIAVGTTINPFTDSNFTYKPNVSLSTSKKLFTYATFSYPKVAGQKEFTSAFPSYTTYRPVSTTQKPLIYAPSTYKTTIAPSIYTPSTFKAYIPVNTSRKQYIYSSSTYPPFISTIKTKKTFIPDVSVYIPDQTTTKPYVTISKTEKPFTYATFTNKSYIPAITSQKPLTFASSIYKPKPFVSANESINTFTPAFSTYKPSLQLKQQKFAPPTYQTYVSVSTARTPLTFPSSTYKPFVSISTSQKPFTSAASTYKPFVKVSETQKPFTNNFTNYKQYKSVTTTQKESTYLPFTHETHVSVTTTEKPFTYVPVTNKSYVSVTASLKPSTYAASTYRPFIPVSEIQKLSTTLFSTFEHYKTLSTTEKSSSYTPSSYKPYAPVSKTKKVPTDTYSIFGSYEPARTSRKPFTYTSSTYKPSVPVSEIQKPNIPSFTSYKPSISVSIAKKPHTYAPFPYKPDFPSSTTQKLSTNAPSTVPVVLINTTQKPFTYASTNKHFTTSFIPSRNSAYTTQKSITKVTTFKPLTLVNRSMKPLTEKSYTTEPTIFKTTAYPAPKKRPTTSQEDRSYLPPQPEGYYYPKPKIAFNFK